MNDNNEGRGKHLAPESEVQQNDVPVVPEEHAAAQKPEEEKQSVKEKNNRGRLR